MAIPNPPYLFPKPCFTLIPYHFILLLFPLLTTNAALLFAHHRHSTAGGTHHYNPRRHSNHSQCNLFVGEWVRDETYPLYQTSSCPVNVIDPQFDCQHYGRPDSDYLKYRWAPTQCELQRFDGAMFIQRMRGKSVMFVGDSLGKNQWESLVCMVAAGLGKMTSSSMNTSPRTQVVRGYPLSFCKFLDYDVTISYYKAPYLVDIDEYQGKRVLRLGQISDNAKSWSGIDVLLFNTGHWWTHMGHIQGWDYVEFNGKMYEDIDRLTAMENALRTWSHWVDSNIDPSRTTVFFQSISPVHDSPTDWNTGAAMTITSSMTGRKNCYGETEPVTGAAFPADGVYPAACVDQMRVVISVLGQMGNPPYLLDITRLSALRKDAHPSIYSGDLSPSQRANPYRSSDCSHWCLPGLPDTWNQLFYSAMFF